MHEVRQSYSLLQKFEILSSVEVTAVDIEITPKFKTFSPVEHQHVVTLHI